MRVRFNPTKTAALSYLQSRQAEQEDILQRLKESPETDEETGKVDEHLTGILKENAERFIQLLNDQQFLLRSHTREDVLMEMELP